jgi:Anti-sigma-K factor rskA, C-terminal
VPVNVAPTPGALFADIAVDRPEGSLTPHLSATGSLRALLAFVSIVLVAVSVVHVHRSAAAAMTRAEAAERTATESQRTARDAVTAASDRAERAIAEALTHAARAERMIEVMAAPDARRIELSGRTGAPGAAGHALYSRSRGVIVSATEMPPPAEGHVFQVWATTATGSVSLGLAAPDAQGRLAAAYELPRDLAGSIRGFLVTLEREGGSESPGVLVIANR